MRFVSPGIRSVRVAIVCAALSALVRPVAAQEGGHVVYEESVAPGANYDKAEFRLWLPRDVATVRGIVVLVPGSNGDGRAQAEDSTWQSFAARHELALIGCRFTDKKHDQNFIEEYVNVSRGSGQALLDALASLGKRSNHPELATAPFLMWGMSAGGEFNYEFVSWKPERVIAFVVNKGGIYYTALAPRAARSVPGILFVGEKDLAFRTNTIVGLFAVNRRAGALWALSEEPGAAHIVGRSRDMAMIFFDDVISLRLRDGMLNPVTERSGVIGDMNLKTFRAMPDSGALGVPTAWLPTPRVARAWQAVETSRPIEP